MSRKTILTLGSLNADLVMLTPRVPLAGETMHGTSFTTVPGGKGLNQCLAAHRLSHPSASSPSPYNITSIMMGSVGNDEFAPLLLNTLSSNGMSAAHITQLPNSRTGVAVIMVEEQSGMNRIVLSKGANGEVAWEKGWFERNKEVGMVILQLEVPMEAVEECVKEAEREGVVVIFNPAPAPVDGKLPEGLLGRVDYLIVNETEAALISGVPVEVLDEEEGVRKVGERLRGLGAKRGVVITLGGRGCWWSGEVGEKGEWDDAFVPVMTMGKVVDTTGAGDTWVGAFAAGLMEGMGMKESVMWAGKAAGISVCKEGAQGGIPWRSQME